MANTFNLGNGNWAQKTEKLLAYNAENNNYKPLPFDFDRASTATRVNKQGLIETVATDEPRIDFLNNSKGHLLLEPQRTNAVTYSEDFSDSSWIKTRATIISNDTTSPDGSVNASKLSANSDNTNHEIAFIFSFTNNDFAFSVFAKKEELDKLTLFYTGINKAATFDLTNGTTTSATFGTLPSKVEMEDYGNGWYRCSITDNTNGASQCRIRLGSGSAFIGNDTDGVYIYGAQLEEGSYATSYIPTQGETNGVTRLVDACYNNNLGNVIGQTEGTFYIETIPLGSTTSFTERIMQFEASGSDFITFQRYANSNLTFYGTDGSNSWTIQGLNLFVGGETIKIAGAYKDNDIVLYVNGVQIGTNNTANAPQVDRMWFANNASGSLAYSGSHKEVKFYNTRLSNSELATLTTL